MCGWWDPELNKRVGGLGFHHAAELARDYTPTQIERPNGRQPIALDGIVLNTPLADAYVSGSYRVHDFRDPDNLDSDHRRVSIMVDI
ncbi:hypothetical protein [Actinomadura chokoriensis]|uniref:hypothetical protein n=1 Tax=Actinomadura chokoriensis TaxID=454156 RepID=UPI0031F87EEA